MEYSILLGIFLVAVLAFMTTLGDWAAGQWMTVCNIVTTNTICR